MDKKNKIIFLDVDGVLNCPTTKDRVDDCLGVDERKVALFSTLVLRSRAKIVLTSTWKDGWYKRKADKIKQDEFGDRPDSALGKFSLEIYAKTRDNALERGAGIKAWLRGKKVDTFVILDDAQFDYDAQDLTPYWVKTNPMHGLTVADVIRAESILCGKEKTDR